MYAVALPVQANTTGEGCSERLARRVGSILRQVFVEIFVGNLRLSTGESCVARLRHRPRFAAGQSRRRTPRRRTSSSGRPVPLHSVSGGVSEGDDVVGQPLVVSVHEEIGRA